MNSILKRLTAVLMALCLILGTAGTARAEEVQVQNDAQNANSPGLTVNGVPVPSVPSVIGALVPVGSNFYFFDDKKMHKPVDNRPLRPDPNNKNGQTDSDQPSPNPPSYDWGEWEVTTPATCTEKGVETRVDKNDAGHVETREIAAAGHKGEPIPGKAATCTEPGLTEGVRCAVCGEILTAQQEIPAGHVWGEWEDVETKDGVTLQRRVCQRDESHTEERNVDAPAADNGDGSRKDERDADAPAVGSPVIPPHTHTGGTATCTEQAICSACGQPYGDIDPDNHDWGEWTDASYDTKTHMKTQQRVCKRDESHVETREEKLGRHDKLPDGITVICGNKTYQFNDGKLTLLSVDPYEGSTSVTVPDIVRINALVSYPVTTIASYAFKKCGNITTIRLGKNVTRIEERAFYDCKKLSTLRFRTIKAVKLSDKAFSGVPLKIRKNLLIRVNKDMSASIYKKLKKKLRKADVKTTNMMKNLIVNGTIEH